MSPETGGWTIPEVVRLMRRIEGTLGKLEARLDHMSADFVSRNEWNLRAQAHDREVRDLKASVAKVASDVESRRAPWWSVAAVLTGAGSLLITLIVVITG